MIASLGMYDMPHLQHAHDRLWSGIRAALGYGPEKLTRGTDLWAHWQAPELLLSQTCGLPYRARLHDHVTLVGTPDYALPDCPPGHYFSYMVRAKDDPRDLTALARSGKMAFNDGLSQSGWAAPVAHLATHGLVPRQVMQTDGHVNSLTAVLEGRADYAAIDALTFDLWAEAAPQQAALIDRFDRTVPSPALPFITAPSRDPEPLFDAVASAITGLSASDRAKLRLRGIVKIPSADYLALPVPPEPPAF
ncbi:MAG: phosphate/phosphite/phosphonate ABC transporter substrate-binding protein [Tateyamaria sp.]